MYTLDVEQSSRLFNFILKLMSSTAVILLIFSLFTVLDGEVGLFGNVYLIFCSLVFPFCVLSILGVILYKMDLLTVAPSKQIIVKDGYIKFPFLLFCGLGVLPVKLADFLVITQGQQYVLLTFKSTKVIRLTIEFALQNDRGTVTEELLAELGKYTRTSLNSEK